MCNLGEAIARKNREEGRLEGIDEGIDEGISKGEEKLGKLILKMNDSGSSQEEMKKAASDAKYRAKLYVSYGIV
ncbi:MAG: hypothetical protein IJ088_04210 [Clostridia bacterium]|nr:hypothetical protein [Clostridia bacterium]